MRKTAIWAARIGILWGAYCAVELIMPPVGRVGDSQALAQVPTIPLGQQPKFVPAEINAAVNFLINQINQYTVVCSALGCDEPGILGVTPPVVTGTCATAGAGTGFAVQSGANSHSGTVTCASSANTQAIITWATAHTAVPQCVWSGTAGAITTATNAVGSLTLNYSSVGSNVLTWICTGQ